MPNKNTTYTVYNDITGKPKIGGFVDAFPFLGGMKKKAPKKKIAAS